jgi:hypothetical protein
MAVIRTHGYDAPFLDGATYRYLEARPNPARLLN